MDQRRTIDEVNTLYELEAEICDVYVEGATDKHFLDWFLRRKGYENVTVYPIDLVDVPQELLETHSLSIGSNRSKVIALSCELARQLPDQRSVMCIVDRDSDDLNCCLPSNPYLFPTDGNSLELYALKPVVMEKFLLVALAGFPISAGNLISRIVAILETIFAIRQTNERLNLGMEWIPFGTYVTFDQFNMSFKEAEFVAAYLHKNKKWRLRDRFTDMKNEIKENLNPDVTKRIRGHDLSELLHIVVRKFRKDRAFANSAILEGCLMTAIESGDLEAHPLFAALERRAAAFA